MSILRVGIVTVSDRCSAGETIDKSGDLLRNLVAENLNANISHSIVPDEFHKIEAELLHLSDDVKAHLILTTGGTGFAVRDITPEVTRRVIEREAPQLSLAMALESFKKTKFAALSRAVCGIRQNTLIVNMPGSPKAVQECFMAIVDVLEHAIDLINGQNLQNGHGLQHSANRNRAVQHGSTKHPVHICPHKTGTGEENDRNSIYPMLAVDVALQIILKAVKPKEWKNELKFRSPINIPGFRASIKDGYAVKIVDGGFESVKNVIGYISAGEDTVKVDFSPNECYKINTGAAVPHFANAVVQVEDTELLEKDADGTERIVKILEAPRMSLDIREIGSDRSKGDPVFSTEKNFPGIVPFKSLLASVGVADHGTPHIDATVCIISTGDELTAPGEILAPGKIYDSNSTMLSALLEQHGFNSITAIRVNDTFEGMQGALKKQMETNRFLIFSGSVSMGDKDFLKPVLMSLNFTIHFGRVNIKPGKPMTFASHGENGDERYVFGLPGNPVSAFVTFNLFVLPALRKQCGYSKNKLSSPTIPVELSNSVELDPRPEYARASISMKNGKFHAEIADNQISSRLASIENADVLVHLPARTAERTSLQPGAQSKASILKQHFISKYLD